MSQIKDQFPQIGNIIIGYSLLKYNKDERTDPMPESNGKGVITFRLGDKEIIRFTLLYDPDKETEILVSMIYIEEKLLTNTIVSLDGFRELLITHLFTEI